MTAAIADFAQPVDDYLKHINTVPLSPEYGIAESDRNRCNESGWGVPGDGDERGSSLSERNLHRGIEHEQ